MHFRLNVQIDWDIDTEDSKVVFPRLEKVFARFRLAFPESTIPRDGVGWANFETTNESLIPRIRSWLDKEGENYQLARSDCWTIEEMARARWLEILYLYSGARVDVDSKYDSLNEYPVVCDSCRHVDTSVVPVPYKVQDVVLKKNVDVFPGDKGLLVVKKPVKDVLLDLIEDQIDWGEVVLVNSFGKRVPSGKGNNMVYWIRPKHGIGGDLRGKPESPCSKCGRFTTCFPDHEREGRVHTGRFLVEHFGKKQLNIAWVGNCIGPNTVVVSGGLWAHLYNCGVKGLVLPEEGLYSSKGQPPVEPERRFANLKTGKDDKVMRLKMWWQKKKPF
jgi:hypothetical protein